MAAEFAPTERRVGLSAVQVENFTVAKGAAELMANGGLGSIPEVRRQVELLLLEDKFAEAACLLFNINKQDVKFWFKLKMALLESSYGHRELFLMATLLQVAERLHLSESFNLVPGLYSLAGKNETL
jgi:hypothetical protein